MSHRKFSPATMVVAILLVPLAIPAIFLLLGPSGESLRAQEVAPKQSFATQSQPTTSRPRTVNAKSLNKEVGGPLQKPSGKMEFVPDSTISKSRQPSPSARPATTSVVRRPVQQQPSKYTAAQPKRPTPTRWKSKPAAVEVLPPAVPEPIAEAPEEVLVQTESAEPNETPTVVARRSFVPMELDLPEPEPAAPPEPEAAAEPEVMVAEIVESPAEFGERPEPLLPEIERPIVQARPAPTKLLNDEDLELDMPAPEPKRGVVNLYFEEEASTDEEVPESMDIADRKLEADDQAADPIFELPTGIQVVTSQSKADDSVPAVAQEDEVLIPSADVLAELKPIGSIEIRKAVEIPQLAEMDNPKLREPADQARAMLRKRPPFKYWPVYREPWSANRDSFAFHHQPLWFEDPNLERCGKGYRHFSSISSYIHFNANISILPYRMTAEPAWCCVRSLPDCNHCQKFGYDAYLPPWSWRAAAVQAGAVVGFIYAIP